MSNGQNIKDKGQYGRLNLEKLESLLDSYDRDAATFQCGPPLMIKQVRSDLMRIGFSKSVNTNLGKRDSDLRSSNLSDANKFPEMTFESQSITLNQGDQYTVTGVMKIKDVSKSLEVPFTYLGSKQHPFDPKQELGGFEAHLTIDRMEFKVGNGIFFDMGTVGKDVEVLILLETTRKK